MPESSVEDYVKGGGGKDAPPSFDVGSPSVPMLSAQPAPDQGLGKLEKEAGALRADTAAAEATIKANSAKKLSIADQISQLKPPDLPKTEPPVKPPGEGPQYNPLEAFGSPASWLAVFGGLLTRHPLRASLDASASAMKAYRERDLEAYEQHLKTWKVQADYAGKLQQYQLDLYRTAMDRHKGDIDQLMTQFNLIASANQDVTMLHTLKSGDFSLSEKLYHDRVQQQERYEDRKLKLEEVAHRREHDLRMENTPERNAYDKFLEENPRATAAERAAFKQKLQRSGGAALKPEQIAFSRWLTEHPEADDKEILRKLQEIQALSGKQTPQMVATRKFIEDNPEAGAEEIQHFIVGFKEDADGVAARKDRKLDQGDRRLDISETKVMNDQFYKEDKLRLMREGLDETKAKNIALENWRERSLEVREKVTGAKREAAVAQTDRIITQGEDLLKMIDANPNVVGGRGIIGGAFQTAKGIISPRAKVDDSFQRFETAMKTWRTEVNLAISQSKYYSTARMAEMAKTLPGLERFQSPQDAAAGIKQMLGLFSGAKMELGDAPASNASDVSEADLQFTAEKYGIPVAEVKKRLGL